ncbi:YeeE/YedE family protein [Methyloferula stellata]|uniref:YeeE/YedE family protein n=1 Tax=Methyloferula stellata TaxID=876270 RepID=UPI00037F62F5|nr:YeeE/YedE family protein [Methyloferula stellata]
MTEFTPFSAALGGALIGFSALILFLLDGRIAGISGILGNLLAFRPGEIAWRLAFLAGLVAAPALYAAAGGRLPPLTVASSIPLLLIGGFLVGFGTRLGNGCTSGHGVCGIARFSPRSIAATLIFMAAAAVTVFIMRHVIG